MKPGTAKVTIRLGFQKRTFTIPGNKYLELVRKLEELEKKSSCRNSETGHSDFMINGERFV